MKKIAKHEMCILCEELIHFHTQGNIKYPCCIAHCKEMFIRSCYENITKGNQQIVSNMQGKVKHNTHRDNSKLLFTW